MLERLGSPRIVAAFAEEDAVYVVGGAVRDVLLDRTPRQLDFVVEGDAVAVGRRVAARLGGRLIVHDRFGTAAVVADGVVVDVAAARRETYERPGALPTVELGATLHDDLARRDFTVNAIALRLADGELVGWPGAEDDLRAGVLRVLHSRSFVDDPTRLLRMVRYAARLGFAADPSTASLAVAAISERAVATVTGARLGAEVRLLLSEPLPEALVGLEARGLGSAVIGSGFAVDPDVVRRALELCPPDARADLVALAACCRGVADLAAALDRLEFEAAARDTVVEAAGVGALEDGSDVELWRRLRRWRPEAVVVAGAVGSGSVARRWLGDVRRRRLEITGHDVVAGGLEGPAVGAALERAMEAMLGGLAPDRDSQLSAALARE